MRTLRIVLALTLALAPSYALAADTLGKTTVRTGSATDLNAVVTGGDGTAAQVAATNGAAAGNGLFVLGGLVQTSIPTLTNGRSSALSLDAGGRVYVVTDSAVNLRSNITQIAGAAPSATNPLWTVLSDGAAAYTGTKTGQLPSALGQTTMSGSVSVAIASNQSTLNVSQGAPTGSGSARVAPTNIASAGSSTIVLKSSVGASLTTKPYQIVIASAAAVMCKLQYNDNATITPLTDVITSPANATVVWTPPPSMVSITTSSTATTQQYEAVCTNFDSAAQDVHASIVYCASASGC